MAVARFGNSDGADRGWAPYYLLPTTHFFAPMTPKQADSTKNSTETSGSLAADGSSDALGAAPAGGSGLEPRAGPASGLSAMLAEHCQRLGAEGGAILTVEADGQVGIAAVWPRPKGDDEPPVWLTTALRAAAGAAGVEGGAATALPLHESGALYGDPARRHVVLMPLQAAMGGSEPQDRGRDGAEGILERQTSGQKGQVCDLSRVKCGKEGANEGETGGFAGETRGQEHGREGQKGWFCMGRRGFGGSAGGLGGARRAVFSAKSMAGRVSWVVLRASCCER